MEQQIVEGFGDYLKQEQGVRLESTCYLKTKTDHYKSHWALLEGNEIYCFRRQGDAEQRLMHCLAGTFIQDIPQEECPDTQRIFYPVKIVLPPNKSRILYFDKSDVQKEWKDYLKKAMCYSNVFDFYDVGSTLGKGQFGLVKLATHKKTGA